MAMVLEALLGLRARIDRLGKDSGERLGKRRRGPWPVRWARSSRQQAADDRAAGQAGQAVAVVAVLGQEQAHRIPAVKRRALPMARPTPEGLLVQSVGRLVVACDR